LSSAVEYRSQEPQADHVIHLEHALTLAERVTAHAYSRAQVLALGALNPPHATQADDHAHLGAMASLYLMSQLEHASLLPSVELLAKMAVSGGLPLDLGSASSRLMQFWQHRNERFSPEERQSLFDRLFNADFDNFMIDLCEALYKLDEGAARPGTSNPLEQAKVRTVAAQLWDHLLNHTTGESAFAATDILAAINAAIGILKDSQLEHAFGAHTLWTTVQAILRRYGGTAEDSPAYVTRGKAGLTILTWLADAQPMLTDSARPFVGLDSPVISAAVDWLSTSLTIEQTKTDASKQEPAAASSAEGT
jgi:hypothetical protein